MSDGNQIAGLSMIMKKALKQQKILEHNEKRKRTITPNNVSLNQDEDDDVSDYRINCDDSRLSKDSFFNDNKTNKTFDSHADDQCGMLD